MTSYNKKKLAGIVFLSAAYLGTVLAVGNKYAFDFATIISQTLDQPMSKTETIETDEEVDTEYFSFEYESMDALQEAEKAYSEEVQSEGVVLLQNPNSLLPLNSSETRMTLLGIASRDALFVGGSYGYGSAVETLKESFESSGFSVNPTMIDFYNSQSISEINPTNFSTEARNSISSYSDVGVVVISRSGSEGNDISDVSTLDITEDEEAVIDYAIENFGKAVVLLNTLNVMDLSKLTDKNVAVLYIGASGDIGMGVVPDILNGTINPSGKLTDTYNKDLATSHPAMYSYGDQDMLGIPDGENVNNYVNYVENIYIGYRYYETRYADVVSNRANVGSFSYSDTVVYPFGHGLSYTEYSYSNFNLEEGSDTITLSVDVTNSGSVAGKEAVGFYMQSPYTEYDIANGVEKSAIQLVGFEKSPIINAGATETITTTFSKEEMKAYDSNGAKTYIVDAGDYYFTAGKDVHEAMNNVLARQGYSTSDGMTENGDNSLVDTITVNTLDTTTYATSNNTAITNQFDNTALSYYMSDKKYVTRNDWSGSLPSVKDTALTATDAMVNDMHNTFEEDSSLTMPTTGATNGINAVSLRGVSYDDESWDSLLDQMTAEEMMTLISVGGYQTSYVASINYPGSIDQDSMQTLVGTMMGGRETFTYCAESLLATTWNKDLVDDFGYYISQDCLLTGITGWYAPGINMHRIPNAGRNPDYYSEDPLMTGTYGAGVSKQAQDHGVVVYVKHLALNDQETNRSSIFTFATEQSIREIYLKPFEMCMNPEKGGTAKGVMTAMNNIGMTYASSHYNLLNDVLRDEWNFDGIVITDAALSASAKINARECLLAGTDLFLCTNAGVFEVDGYASDVAIMNRLRESSHRIIYSFVNSMAMNGFAPNTRVVPVTPAWQIVLITVDVVLGVLLLAGVVTMIVVLVKDRKEGEKNEKPQEA